MPDYRLYVLSDDGHITQPPKVINCPDDAAAVARAKQLLDGHAIEIWQAARHLGRLDPGQD